MILLTSGCAVMNTSVLETAQTIEQGKFKFGVETNFGLELTSTISAPEDTTKTFDEEGLFMMPIIGIKSGVGITNNLELNGKIWVTSYIIGGGSKVYLKYRLPLSNEKISLAIAPGFNYINTETEGETNGNETYSDVQTKGGELPILFSYHAHENFVFYGAARYSFDYIDIRSDENWVFPEELRGTHLLHRLGLIFGLSIEFQKIYLRSEIGFESAKRINGDFSTIPILSGGFGFEM